MAYTITEVKEFDHKRNKVILDNGEVTFLLYKGECRRARIPAAGAAGTVLEEADYRRIMEEILLPRAKKRVLYYLKNGDRSREEIRRKLRKGYYPSEVIDETFAFLDKYSFADDERYAGELISELRGTKSVREIEARLRQKGVQGKRIRELLNDISREEEDGACLKALRKKYPSGVKPADRAKAFAYLARRGFGAESVNRALKELLTAPDDDRDYEDNAYGFGSPFAEDR